MSTAPPVEVFSALADDNRQRLLSIMGGEGAATSTALSTRLEVSRQGVDKHLRLLRDAGLVTSRRDGREVFHDVRHEPLREAARWLDDVAAAWDRRLAGVKAAAGRATTAVPPRPARSADAP